MFSKFFTSFKVSPLIAGAAIAGAALAMNAPATMASVITWGSPTDVSGDANVSTAGTLVSAYSFTADSTPPSPVVNGVTFTGLSAANSNTSVTFSGDTIASSGGMASFGSFGAPSGFSSAYQTLLTSAYYSKASADPLTLTLNNLTPGTNYQFEVWANDARSLAAGRTETVSGSPSDSVTLAYHTGTLGAGQFVLGTFTGDSTGSQVITLAGIGSTGPQINAFQLRESVPVPEPASLGLLAVGGLGLLLLGKRRRV